MADAPPLWRVYGTARGGPSAAEAGSVLFSLEARPAAGGGAAAGASDATEGGSAQGPAASAAAAGTPLELELRAADLAGAAWVARCTLAELAAAHSHIQARSQDGFLQVLREAFTRDEVSLIRDTLQGAGGAAPADLAPGRAAAAGATGVAGFRAVYRTSAVTLMLQLPPPEPANDCRLRTVAGIEARVVAQALAAGLLARCRAAETRLAALEPTPPPASTAARPPLVPVGNETGGGGAGVPTAAGASAGSQPLLPGVTGPGPASAPSSGDDRKRPPPGLGKAVVESTKRRYA